MTEEWKFDVWSKALRKTEISEFFIFASFGIVWLPKFGNFSPNSQKFCKKTLEISPGQKTLFLGQKQGFPNIPNLRNILNLFYSEFSKNYKNMTLKSNFYFWEKHVPTRIIEFKFGMQGISVK